VITLDRLLGHVPTIRLLADPIGALGPIAAQGDGFALVRVGPKQVAVVARPDLAHEVLVVHHRSLSKGGTVAGLRMLLGDGMITADGAGYLERRRAAAPAFAAARLPDYAPEIVRLAGETASSWSDDSTRRLHDDLLVLSLRIASRSFLGVDPGIASHGLVAHADTLAALSGLASVPWAATLARMPIPPARRFRRSRAALDAGLDRLLSAHAGAMAGEAHPDALCLVRQQATDDDGAVDDTRVRDEAMTMLIAGHVTVASATTWAILLLGDDATWTARLRAELATVLGDRAPEAGDVPRLPVTRAVLAEAMRLYPPAWAIGRVIETPFPLGGRVLPRGTIVLVSPWVLGRDARSFPDPERFDPGRWLDERAAAVPRHAYIPFGLGPRRCIGEGFAWQEGVLVLATLLGSWSLRPATATPTRIRAGVTLNPPDGAPVLVTRPA
jgi:cytochrome P450